MRDRLLSQSLGQVLRIAGIFLKGRETEGVLKGAAMVSQLPSIETPDLADKTTEHTGSF